MQNDNIPHFTAKAAWIGFFAYLALGLIIILTVLYQ